jgi:type IV pilus assembly protein PilA
VVVRRATEDRGFTLVEMMIVVVIVGILASLAVVGYRKLVQSSHISEAQQMVQDIRVAQESYHSETQQYANISTSLYAYYPNASPNGRTATAWGAACVGCFTGMDWSMLPLHVDGPVLFGYATVAGAANTTPASVGAPAQVTVNSQTVTFPSPSPVDWYIVSAGCDLNNDGTVGTHVYTTSWTNQVFVDAEE